VKKFHGIIKKTVGDLLGLLTAVDPSKGYKRGGQTPIKKLKKPPNPPCRKFLNPIAPNISYSP
jgi:hypothetical protein